MKLKVFNWVIFVLFLVGALGFGFTQSKLFLAGAVIFGVWCVVSLIEHFVRGRSNGKVLKMVKE